VRFKQRAGRGDSAATGIRVSLEKNVPMRVGMGRDWTEEGKKGKWGAKVVLGGLKSTLLRSSTKKKEVERGMKINTRVSSTAQSHKWGGGGGKKGEEGQPEQAAYSSRRKGGEADRG